jgi:hypothetical protein
MVARELQQLCPAALLNLTCHGELRQNLTFKIKFGAANICSKFEKFCQILSAHSNELHRRIRLRSHK